MKRLLLFIMIMVLWSSCKPKIENDLAILQTPESNIKVHPGKKLLETTCYVCHSPTASMENRLAPPMMAVKMHYLTEGSSVESFSQEIWDFVKKPSQEHSKMPGAIRKFGLMPLQDFKERDVKLISEYLFLNNIEEPSWFGSHKKSECQQGNTN